MSEHEDGGPAYPGVTSTICANCGDMILDDDRLGVDSGLSMLDYYAGQANEEDIKHYAEWANVPGKPDYRSRKRSATLNRTAARFAFADAMIAEKQRREGEPSERCPESYTMKAAIDHAYLRAIAKCNGRKDKAAKLLGIGARTIYRWSTKRRREADSDKG